MDIIDTHHTRTGRDLEYFGDLIGAMSNSTPTIPKLPLHEYGPLNIQYSVLEATPARCAQRFAEIAADLRAIAEDQALKYAEETTQLTSDDKHHRAVLVMPQGKVMYSAVWIERAAKSEPVSGATQHKSTFSAQSSRTFIRCDCGWGTNVPQGIDAVGKLEAAYAEHVNKEMGTDE